VWGGGPRQRRWRHWAALVVVVVMVVVLSVNEAIGQCNCGGSGSSYMQLQ
jgi:hypothetical protein